MRAWWLVLLASCYSPNLTNGQFKCQNGLCPSGFVCICGGTCLTPGSSCADGGTPDQGAGGDMAADMTKGVGGCTNGNGQRAATDPGLPLVAACPAAWAVRGVTSPASKGTPCARQPTGNGKSATGTDCSSEDNCAQGWHICNTETELMMRGFTKADCNGLASSSDFWVTRQPGAPPMPVGPPSCAEPGPRTLFGCGGLGMASGGCTILVKVVVETPAMGDQCSDATTMQWLCPDVDMTKTESSEVLKPGLAGGGVLCCKD